MNEWQHALISGQPFIDVRAPLEFDQGHAPGAHNLPILTNEERHQVGLTYKIDGAFAATQLGHKLVSGSIKEERVEKWINHLKAFPSSWLYCARGGQRSQVAEEWILESGMSVNRIPGGYKHVRHFLLAQIERLPEDLNFNVLTGMTGSGKTALLRGALSSTPQIIDLEWLARHRGSAFGPTLKAQPTQAQFENELAIKLTHSLRACPQNVWLEDESRTIGRLVLPKKFFARATQAPMYLINESLEQRALRILDEYVILAYQELYIVDQASARERLFERLSSHLLRIGPKLGGLHLNKVQTLLNDARIESNEHAEREKHLEWIQILLKNYYDPFYQHHIEKNRERLKWQGTFQEAQHLLKGYT